MGPYLGDFAEDATVHFIWDTNSAAGASITRATDGSIRVYKDNGTSEKTTSNGITDTEDFDSLTGIHVLTIDTSNDTGDAGFWVTGSNYVVVLQGAVIDSQTVNAVLCSFSIENRFMRGTDVTDVNAQVVDVMRTDTVAEISAVPAKNATLHAMIQWLFLLARNKRTTTSTTDTLRDDADTGTIGTSTVSDDGTTFTRGKYA
jgi:hypothetical protein